MDRLEATIRRNFYHANVRDAVRRMVSSCTICPRVRTTHVPYGHLAPRQAPIAPWSEVHVDLIGPWKLNIRGIEVPFMALTMIDPVTNLVELVRIENKRSEHVALLFENTWLSRHPLRNQTP